MNRELENDLLQLDFLLAKVKEQGLDYLKNISSRPTTKNIEIAISKQLPETGLGTTEALQHFNQKFEQIIVSSSGPRYWGYVIGGSTPASIVGDWLTTIYDQCTFAVKG